jgi:hypothetical protein
VTAEQAQQLVDLLQTLVEFGNAVRPYFDAVGGIGSYLLALGLLLGFSHGFRAGSGSGRHEV